MESPLPAKFVQEQVWLVATRPTIPTVTTEMPMPNQDPPLALRLIVAMVVLITTALTLALSVAPPSTSLSG